MFIRSSDGDLILNMDRVGAVGMLKTTDDGNGGEWALVAHVSGKDLVLSQGTEAQVRPYFDLVRMFLQPGRMLDLSASFTSARAQAESVAARGRYLEELADARPGPDDPDYDDSGRVS